LDRTLCGLWHGEFVEKFLWRFRKHKHVYVQVSFEIKGEFVPVINQLNSTILDLGTRWRLAVSFTARPLYLPVKEPRVHIEYESGWAPEPVWTLWSREKSLVPAENRTPAVLLLARRYTD
jgi:hypothetical protein